MIQTKESIKQKFQRGKIPKASDFHDWMDSFYHRTQDRIRVGLSDHNPTRDYLAGECCVNFDAETGGFAVFRATQYTAGSFNPAHWERVGGAVSPPTPPVSAFDPRFIFETDENAFDSVAVGTIVGFDHVTRKAAPYSWDAIPATSATVSLEISRWDAGDSFVLRDATTDLTFTVVADTDVPAETDLAAAAAAVAGWFAVQTYFAGHVGTVGSTINFTDPNPGATGNDSYVRFVFDGGSFYEMYFSGGASATTLPQKIVLGAFSEVVSPTQIKLTSPEYWSLQLVGGGVSRYTTQDFLAESLLVPGDGGTTAFPFALLEFAPPRFVRCLGAALHDAAEFEQVTVKRAPLSDLIASWPPVTPLLP